MLKYVIKNFDIMLFSQFVALTTNEVEVVPSMFCNNNYLSPKIFLKFALYSSHSQQELSYRT